MKNLQVVNKELKDLSIRDDLTGLLNRRGILSIIEDRIKISKRIDLNFLVIFADLDGF